MKTFVKWFLVLVVVEFLLIGLVAVTYAQDETAVNFTISCQSTPDNVIVLVEANGVTDYGTYLVGVEPFVSTIPEAFTTRVGKYVLGTVDNSQGTVAEVHFTTGEYDLSFNIGTPEYMQWCDAGTPVVNEHPAEEDNCPAWAIQASTGDVICLWDLPQAPE